jgi:acetylornithine deacetylase
VAQTARGILRDIAELVAIPSVSSTLAERDMPNRPIIEHLTGRLEAAGFGVVVHEIPRRPGKANLIATLGRGAGGLVLAGHTDTVPCDVGRWASDPFVLTERGERLYGLGVCDMKAFFALALAAAQLVPQANLRAPLMILATADEESSMSGARALAAAGRPLGRYAVIGEPTDLQPVRMHKGILMERVRLEGRSGHSSDPALGNNAIDGMQRVVAELLRWREELQRAFRNPAFRVSVPTLNLGRIHGGDNPNRICGACELDLDLRLLPGMSVDALRSELRERVARAVTGTGLRAVCEVLFEGVEAMSTPADSALVRAAEELTGVPAATTSFATEAPFLARLGTEVLVLGPGSVAQAHQPDEYLELRRIQPMVEYLERLIRRFCCG